MLCIGQLNRNLECADKLRCRLVPPNSNYTLLAGYSSVFLHDVSVELSLEERLLSTTRCKARLTTEENNASGKHRKQVIHLSSKEGTNADLELRTILRDNTMNITYNLDIVMVMKQTAQRRALEQAELGNKNSYREN